MALIGSLQGSGKIALADAQFAGLDPRAFDAVTRAVDQGLPIDAPRISDVVSKALDSGQLAVKHAEGTIAVSAGQMRLEQCQRRRQGGRLGAGRQSRSHRRHASTRGWCCRDRDEAAGARPDIFMALKGPLAAPTAQHRRIGADRMADAAGGRQSGTAIARNRERAASGQTAGATPEERIGARAAGAGRPSDRRPGRSVRPEASVGPQN